MLRNAITRLRDRVPNRTRHINSATALIVALTIALPHANALGDVVPPAVPANLVAPDGYVAFRIDRAYGTQNYICLPAEHKAAWAFFGPQATLFNNENEQVITHFLSPNPAENGTPRATWQHSSDTSTVWAMAIRTSTDPDFVAPGAIPWLLLQVVGAQYGPRGPGLDDNLIAAEYIQRVNTAGGAAPSTGCTKSADVGKRALVPYTTDYVFYRK